MSTTNTSTTETPKIRLTDAARAILRDGVAIPVDNGLGTVVHAMKFR
jgi:hypothetical protein